MNDDTYVASSSEVVESSYAAAVREAEPVPSSSTDTLEYTEVDGTYVKSSVYSDVAPLASVRNMGTAQSGSSHYERPVTEEKSSAVGSEGVIPPRCYYSSWR